MILTLKGFKEHESFGGCPAVEIKSQTTFVFNCSNSNQVQNQMHKNNLKVGLFLFQSTACFVLWPGVMNAVDCKSTLAQWLMGHVVAEVTNEDQDHEALTEPPLWSLHRVKGCHPGSLQTLWVIQFTLSQPIVITFFPYAVKITPCIMFYALNTQVQVSFIAYFIFNLFVCCYISSNVAEQSMPHDLQLLYI